MQTDCELYHGDCLDVMKTLPDKSIDLCLTDPHYNAKNIGPKDRKYAAGPMQISPEKYALFCKAWFAEAVRTSKRVVFTPGITNTHNYPQPLWQICWYKACAQSYNKMGGFNAWEPIFVYGKTNKKNAVPVDYIAEFTLNMSKGIEKKHPCPKPLSLYRRLVEMFSKEGETVLDCFMGSGTAGVAAVDLGRNFIGIEIIKEHFEDSRSRVLGTKKGITAYEFNAGQESMF